MRNSTIIEHRNGFHFHNGKDLKSFRIRNEKNRNLDYGIDIKGNELIDNKNSSDDTGNETNMMGLPHKKTTVKIEKKSIDTFCVILITS